MKKGNMVIILVALALIPLIFMSFRINVQEVKAGSTGSGWTRDSLLYPDNSSVERNPSIATDTQGNIFVAYEHFSSSRGHYEIIVSNSSDGGQTWSYLTGIYSPGVDVLNPSLAIATRGNDNIMVAFETTGQIWVMKYIYSQWSYQVITSTGYDHHPQLTFDLFTPIYAYLTYDSDLTSVGNGTDIMFIRSIDYEGNWTTWESPQLLVGGADATLNAMPSITYGSQRVYVAYEKGSPEHRDVYALQNSAFGASEHWSSEPGTLISNINYDEYGASIVASHTSPAIVVAAYTKVFNSADYDVIYSYSNDSGDTWTLENPFAASTAMEQDPWLAVDDTAGPAHIHVAYWKEETVGNRTNGIYYRTANYSTPWDWTAPVQVIDDDGWASASYIRPAITSQNRGGHFYPAVAWTDFRGPTYDIYYSTQGATHVLNSAPPGLQLTVDGMTNSAPVTVDWVAGYNHTLEVTSPQMAGQDSRYVFANWSDGGAQSHQTTAGITETTIVAAFTTQYYLTVTSSYGTAGGQGWYDSGASTQATLTTGTVDIGNGTRKVFTSWSGNGTGTNSTQSDPILINGPKSVTAEWKDQYLLTVGTDPTGLIPQPDASPAGPWYDTGTNVTIDAQYVIGGSYFDHWSIDGVNQTSSLPTNITMNVPRNVTIFYFSDMTPPLITNLQQDPTGQQMQPNQTVTIQVDVTDNQTDVKNVTLSYRTSPNNSTWSTWTNGSMNQISRNTWNSTIPSLDPQTFVQYVVTAYDNSGNFATLPGSAYYNYKVIPEFASLMALMLSIFAISAVAVIFRRLQILRKARTRAESSYWRQ